MKNKKMRKLMRVFALLLALSLLAGCSLIQIDDTKIIVAKVGDKTISKAEFDQYLNSGLAQYGYTVQSQDIQEQLPEIKTSFLEAMIDNLVEQTKAEEAGLVATQEDIDAAYQEAQDWYDQQYSQLLEYYKEDETIEDPEQQALEDIQSYMNMYGFESLDQMAEQTLKSVPADKLYTETVKDVQLSDGDVRSEFDSLVAEDKEQYENDIATFVSDYNGGMTLYWHPEGIFFVKHILLSLSDEQQKEIQLLRSEGDEDGANTYRDEALKDLQTKLDEVLKKIEAGEDFDALIKEYGEDPGMKVEEGETNDGYPTAVGLTGVYVKEFEDACNKLVKEGDTSAPVATDYGYHIIRRYGDMPSGEINFDDVSESLHTRLLSTTQSEAYSAALEQWKSEMKIERFEKKL